MCNYFDEKMKNKIKEIIEDSFNQTDERKPIYICNQLKNLYSGENWTVLFIYQKNNFEYSFHTSGKIFICKYKNRIIIIYPSKKEISNDYNEEEKSSKAKEELNKEISDLKYKLKEIENINKKNKSTIEQLQSKLNDNNIKLESYQKIILEKEKEIEYLKNEIQNNKGNNSFNKTFYSRDQMLALNFISSDQRMHFAVPCVKKDLFVDVEKKLYEQFPQYKETNNTFMVNASIILRFKTIEENKLQSGIPILIITNTNH